MFNKININYIKLGKKTTQENKNKYNKKKIGVCLESVIF